MPAKTLIDTGASESCIDDELAIKLELPVVDVILIAGAGAGGAKEHNVYAAEVNVSALGFKQFGRFAGVHLNSGGQMHEVLLGRTFLSDLIMVYDGRRGQVTIAI